MFLQNFSKEKSFNFVKKWSVISNRLSPDNLNSLTKHIGIKVCDEHGCPTPVGLAVHTLVFILLVFASMQIKY